MAEFQGTLRYLRNTYEEAIFQKAELHIREVDGNVNVLEFYGYVPRSILGKEVTFSQTMKIRGDLVQRLTTIDGNENVHQLVARLKKNK